MRAVMIGLWFVTLLAVGVNADEAAPAEETPAEKTAPAAEPQVVESPASAGEQADAEIQRIDFVQFLNQPGPVGLAPPVLYPVTDGESA